MGGILYVQNLARAVAGLPAEERRDVRLSVDVNASAIEFVDSIANCVDRVYCSGMLRRIGRTLLRRFVEPWVPLPGRVGNPRRFDFVYPELASRHTRYDWAAWIPDFQHHYLPEMFSARERNSRSTYFSRIARSAPAVVVSSDMARQDFARFYPDSPARLYVLKFASYLEPDWFYRDPASIQRKYQLPDRFLLVSNQFWRHKDHAVIVAAAGILKQRGVRPVIVCTGNTHDYRHPQYFSELLDQMAHLGVTDQFRILGLIPRSDQIQLMRRCLAVVQPSRFEGWSTVVEDVRAVGRPILISEFPVHREQSPPDASFFPSGDATELARQISLILTRESGPTPATETAAREDSSRRLAEFGRAFLQICRSTVPSSVMGARG